MNNSLLEKNEAISTTASITNVQTSANAEKTDKTTDITKTTPTTVSSQEPPLKALSDEEKENNMRKEVSALELKNLNVKVMYEMMAVPTYSDYEYRMVTWLILWARKHYHKPESGMYLFLQSLCE